MGLGECWTEKNGRRSKETKFEELPDPIKAHVRNANSRVGQTMRSVAHLGEWIELSGLVNQMISAGNICEESLTLPPKSKSDRQNVDCVKKRKLWLDAIFQMMKVREHYERRNELLPDSSV